MVIIMKSWGRFCHAKEGLSFLNEFTKDLTSGSLKMISNRRKGYHLVEDKKGKVFLREVEVEFTNDFECLQKLLNVLQLSIDDHHLRQNYQNYLTPLWTYFELIYLGWNS